MPLLSRNGPRLLRTAGGKPHATQDDHFDQLPTPPNSNSARSSDSNARAIDTEEDINREPESSGDEDVAVAQVDGPSGFEYSSKSLFAEHTLSPKKTLKSSSAASLGSTGELEKPTSGSQTSLGSKRSNDSESDDAISFDNKRPKKQRTTYSSNIHANQSKQKTKTTYGKAAKVRASRPDKNPSLQVPTRLHPEASPPKAVFKTAIGADLLQSMRSEPAAPEFRPPRSSGDMRNSRSPSLSSLSSPEGTPEVEEIEALNLPHAQPYTPQVDCNICGCNVNKLLREEFEDEHGLATGKRMSYKWQQRFCRYHKRREAEDLWKEKGYPEIDWEGLERRMMKLHTHLEGVLNGTRLSFYRKDLAERQKGGAKTALQAVQSEDAKSGAPVGYYGPRGEKTMTDHIIQHLADKLRKQAAKDKLVASSGIAGGVSGFVQAVLVPELATKLVQEDLKLSDAEARNVIFESSELGDLLNPEIGEKVDKPQHVIVDDE